MITLTTAKKSINPAFFRQPVPQNEIEKLKNIMSFTGSATRKFLK